MMVPDPEGGRSTLEEIFLHASNMDISLTGDASALSTPFSPEYISVDERILQEALVQLTGNPSGGPVSHLGLLFSNVYAPRKGLFGFMFDGDFDVWQQGGQGGSPREGCAVFLDAIGKIRSPGEYLDQVAFTSVHELGHLFNLHHWEPDLCFLNTSNLDASPDLPAYQFLPFQKDWLSQCSSDGAVQPGGSAFENFGIDSAADGGARPGVRGGGKRWHFEISMPVPDFWAFSPVELLISLRLNESAARSAPVPDELHPGYGSFTLWIEEPSGERRRYRPTTRFCGSPPPLVLQPGETITKDLSIFGQAGGYTFRHIGKHRLWATFDVSLGRRLRSNTLEVRVLPFQADTKAAFSEITGQKTLMKQAARAFFYRSARVRPLEMASLKKLAVPHPSGPDAAAAHYALGCSASARVRSRQMRNPQPWEELAKRHLSTAVECESLDPHRRSKAEKRLVTLHGA
ncbi:MAG: hypothetical protein V4726_00215 [Verrucomicrobiota bacterium]